MSDLTAVAGMLVRDGGQVAEVVQKDVAISVASTVGIFAEYVLAIIDDHEAASKMFERGGFTVQDVEHYLADLISLRLMQCRGHKLPIAPSKVEVPVCIYGIIEMIGDYESVDEGLFIRPSTSEKLHLSLEKADKLSMVIRIAGMPIESGLPRVTKIKTDGLYRLAVKDGKIMSCCRGDAVDPVSLLTRTFLDFLPLEDVYGQYRYAYQDIRLVGGAYERLARLGVPN